MLLEPSAITPELAAAALSCPPLDRARRLAEWIGADPAGRALTSSGVLKPALATQACRALGIELPPGKLRSAKDLPELSLDWAMATFAGFIEAGASRVHAVEDLANLPAEDVLRGWLWVAVSRLGVPYEPPCPQCLTVLDELGSSDGPVSMADLTAAVRAATPRLDPDFRRLAACPDCGEVHDAPSEEEEEEEQEEHARDAVRWLSEFGAASTLPGTDPGGSARLTALGRVLATSVLAACSVAPGEDAEALVAAIGALPPKIARRVRTPWLAARPPAVAVRELLGYAEGADPDQRLAALAVAREVGGEGLPAWRQYARRPGFGAFARAWLAEFGEPVAPDERDEAWLMVEALSLMTGSVPEELAPVVFAAAMQQAPQADVAETLRQIGDSGHPRAERILSLVTGLENLVSRAIGLPVEAGIEAGEQESYDAVYQLKITLRGVSKPPVWRRVLVPAGLSLNALHEVIVRAMGWDGGHLHVFSDGFGSYGMPDAELDREDETEVAIGELVEEQGDRLSYTYDFGDGWEHDIRLEKVLPADVTLTTPVCMAGKGACPPEDCGGTWGYTNLKLSLSDPSADDHQDLLDWLALRDGSGFDPAAFAIDEVNARLSRLEITLS